MRDEFMAAHERCMQEYMEANPGCSEDEAYDRTADKAYDRMRDDMADLADRMRKDR